jgi:hypothetical protein
MMKKITVLVFLSVAIASPSFGQEPANPLANCMAQKTTGADREHFAKWIFAVIAKHPVAAPFSNIEEAERDRIDIKTADLITRLLTDECVDATRTTFRESGEVGVIDAFRVMGEIAIQELFRNDEVLRSSENYVKYLDEDLFSKIFE